jgi:hypothetical protein
MVAEPLARIVAQGMAHLGANLAADLGTNLRAGPFPDLSPDDGSDGPRDSPKDQTGLVKRQKVLPADAAPSGLAHIAADGTSDLAADFTTSLDNDVARAQCNEDLAADKLAHMLVGLLAAPRQAPANRRDIAIAAVTNRSPEGGV